MLPFLPRLPRQSALGTTTMHRHLPSRRCLSSVLLQRCALLAVLLMSGTAANAADFDVTLDFWGTTSTVGSFAWAVDQANTTPGVDTIRVQSGLQINADNGDSLAGSPTWLTRFTESVTVEGNGATLVANPAYITTGGLVATKTNIVGSAYSSPLVPGDVVVTPGVSFAEVGISGQDNSGVNVTIRNLNADGVASLLSVNDKATLSVDGGRFTNIVNYTGVDGRSAFDARAGATLNLDGIALNRNFPFGEVVAVGDDYAVFNGSIAGSSSTLNMQNSTITGSYGAGALLWLGGTANVVSSVLSNSGGLQISGDVGGAVGTLNFTNSILELNDGETLQQTQRILTGPDGVANVEASTILYNSLFSNGSNEPFGYEGMPLTAAQGGTINFDSSVVVPLNWDDFFAGNDTSIELTGGSLTADAPEPRLELRLRDGPNVRWPSDPDADDRGRVHTGVPGDRRGQEAHERGRPGAAERPVRASGRARAHPERQRQRVHRQMRPGVAGTGGREDAVHRAGLALGERLRGELQRQASGRAPEAGVVRHPARG